MKKRVIIDVVTDTTKKHVVIDLTAPTPKKAKIPKKVYLLIYRFKPYQPLVPYHYYLYKMNSTSAQLEDFLYYKRIKQALERMAKHAPTHYNADSKWAWEIHNEPVDKATIQVLKEEECEFKPDSIDIIDRLFKKLNSVTIEELERFLNCTKCNSRFNKCLLRLMAVEKIKKTHLKGLEIKCEC